MKSFLIAVLAAVAVCNDAASIQNQVSPGQEDVILFQAGGQEYQKIYDLQEDTTRLSKNEVLLYEEILHMPSINGVQVRDVVYRGNSSIRITRIEVINPPARVFIEILDSRPGQANI